MSTSNGSFDVDAFLDGYEKRRATVTLYQRADLLAEHARLETELARAGAEGDETKAREVVERVGEITEQLEGSGHEFCVEACSHDVWYKLMAEHPPSDDERKALPNAVVGAEFQAHALAECVTSPTITVAQARRMRAEMRPDDFDRLWLAVIECVEGGVEVPKSGLATAVANLFEQHSTNRKTRRSHGRSGRAANGAASPNTSTTKKAASRTASRRTTPTGSKKTGK